MTNKPDVMVTQDADGWYVATLTYANGRTARIPAQRTEASARYLAYVASLPMGQRPDLSRRSIYGGRYVRHD